MGNVLFIDWRLEYRYYTGIFKPSFFDATYDRMRSQYAAQYISYLNGSSDFDQTPTVMGVYGEGGFQFLKDKLSLTLGYLWPWSFEAGTDLQKQLVLSSDELHAKLVIKKGLIPLIDAAGSVSYEKRGVAKDIVNQSFVLIDSNTIFSGEIDVPVPKTSNLDLAVIFATVPVRNASGAIVYKDEAAGLVSLTPSISVETRFHL
jgi:hypothetical protein